MAYVTSSMFILLSTFLLLDIMMIWVVIVVLLRELRLRVIFSLATVKAGCGVLMVAAVRILQLLLLGVRGGIATVHEGFIIVGQLDVVIFVGLIVVKFASLLLLMPTRALRARFVTFASLTVHHTTSTTTYTI